MDEFLIKKAEENIGNILAKNYLIKKPEQASKSSLIIYDLNSPISRVLTEAYRRVLKNAELIDFYKWEPEKLIEKIDSIEKKSIVILIQSSSFRMSKFRWRLELFHRGLWVLEHVHLDSNLESETENYIDALSDQLDDFRKKADFLVKKIEKCDEIAVEGGNFDGKGTAKLVYSGKMDSPKKNVGDFSKMNNVGCMFPIGEVFSEPVDLTKVNGEMFIYAYANIDHKTEFADVPFRVRVLEGKIIYDNSLPEGFLKMLDLVKTENEDAEIWIRELGLGLNKGISPAKRLSDVSAYERVCGVHVSMGRKHDIYREKISDEIHQRFHIDIFPVSEKIFIDGKTVFEKGDYLTRKKFLGIF